MSVLQELNKALVDGTIEVIDLTAPLSSDTPTLSLPEPLGQTWRFELELISDCDDRGPLCYWNNIRTGEHTGTHFDSPNHWVTGRHLEDVSAVSPSKLLRPAAVLDFTAQADADPDFLLSVENVQAWIGEHGDLPAGGWLLYRTGWSARMHAEGAMHNADAEGPHTPGISPECATWLAEETPIIGVGVETVGNDAGSAADMDPPFPCHAAMHGAGKYGLTMLQNLDQLPPMGSMVFAGPLPIVNGSGSPARVLALKER